MWSILLHEPGIQILYLSAEAGRKIHPGKIGECLQARTGVHAPVFSRKYPASLVSFYLVQLSKLGLLFSLIYSHFNPTTLPIKNS